MALVLEFSVQNEDEALEAIQRLEEGLEGSRRTLEAFNEESMRQGFVLRELSAEQLFMDQTAARQREAMTRESFEKWIGQATHASDWTRRAFSTTIGAIGSGIANELVDGTHDWQRAFKGVLKQMIAVTAQMIIMRALMSALTGGGAGWVDFFHSGGAVMHGGGPVRGHGGMALRHDEVPLIAQRGEFLLRRRVAEDIGASRLERLNRVGSLGAAPNYNFSITINMEERADAEAMVERLGPEIVAFLRRESGRGVLVLP